MLSIFVAITSNSGERVGKGVRVVELFYVQRKEMEMKKRKLIDDDLLLFEKRGKE